MKPSTWDAAGMIAGMGSQMIDVFAQPDRFGIPTTGASVAKKTLSGAALGTSILPGWGTAIGAVGGAAMGLIEGSKNRELKGQMRAAEHRMMMQNIQGRSSSMLIPETRFGEVNKGYYRTGGQLPAKGSNTGAGLKPLSSTDAAIEGPQHEQGGVPIPGFDAVAEGGESKDGDFIFSDKLMLGKKSFAEHHKKLAKAQGILERRPKTPEQVNSVRAMQQQKDKLARTQELYKALYNI